jgi:4-methyl-5(b-hydroxyethyl)-thiazole monophosphate biosynthesis
MQRVLIPIAHGSEEIEAITLADVLRRGKCHVTLASVETSLIVKASREVLIQADCFVSDCRDENFDLIALPGGMPGASTLASCRALIGLLERHHQRRAPIAAICAAPAVILGRLGWLNGKLATVFPAFKDELIAQGARYLDEAVVQDGSLFTSQGPATAMQLALALVRFLQGDKAAREVGDGLLLKDMN